jgi:hypothetical protein
MKALSVKQPWANLIASGKKTLETRTWSTLHRGELLIVSSKHPALAPAGCAVAIVDLADCRPMAVSDETAACCKLYDGAFVWIFRNIRRVNPVPIQGKLGIFDVDVDVPSLTIAATRE